MIKHYRWVSLAGLLLAYAVVLFGFADFSDKGNLSHDAARMLMAGVELLAVGLVCAGLGRLARRTGWSFWRLVAVLVAALVIAVYVAQLQSILISNAFISVMALQNAGFITYVLNWQLGLLVFMGLLCGFVFTRGVLASGRQSAQGAEGWPLIRFVAVLLVGLLLWAWIFLLQQKKTTLEMDFREVPIASLVANVGQKSDFLKLTEKRLDELPCLARSQKFDPQYPLQKNVTYTAGMTLQPSGAHGDRKNVIVIFAEGLSARLIGAYNGDAYPGLTPNVDKFAHRSMQVVDYYNHTAATFRGLIGQLSSGLSFEGSFGDRGWLTKEGIKNLSEINRNTIPRILGRSGYESFFFSPELKDNPFNSMLDTLGFDSILTHEIIGDALLHGQYNERGSTEALNDDSMFEGLTEFLKVRHGKKDDKPFFIGLYNIGTHAFIGVNDTDKKYLDGSNSQLNKVHVLDDAFGQFLTYFLSSEYAKNTILVFTTDHATYWGEKDYRKLFKSELKPYFIDRVPLLVYDPFHELPPRLDAHGRNSLDLAPTLLHLLGMNHARNSFLGNTLLSEGESQPGFGAIGYQYFMTTVDDAMNEAEVPASRQAWFGCMKDVAQFYYSLESTHRLATPEGR